MSKIICGHCGTANDADNKFCISCGAPLAEKETFGNGHFGDAFIRNSRSYDRGEEIIYTSVAPRNIALCIILTLATFGIYGLFWLYKMGQKCDEIREINASSGILYLILGEVRRDP